MPVHAYLYSRLIEESEARVEMAAHFDSPADMFVASRILLLGAALLVLTACGGGGGGGGSGGPPPPPQPSVTGNGFAPASGPGDTSSYFPTGLQDQLLLDLTQTISNAAMETVDVPAGTFANALKQVTTINATVHDGTQSAPVTGSDTAWYAPGAGEIKDQSTASGGGTTINTSMELRGYTLNGTLHGIAPSTAPAARSEE